MYLNLYGLRAKAGIRLSHRLNQGLLIAVSVLTIALLLTGGCNGFFDGCDDEPVEVRDDSFAVGNDTRIVVKTGNGGIEVTAGSDNEVRVQADLRVPDKIDYRISQQGDTITIEAKVKGGRPWKDCTAAEIVVTVPAATDVDLETSNGFIILNGIEGIGKMRTSNGKIDLYDVTGGFTGETSNGAVYIDTFEGTAVFSTSNGQVSAHNVKGEVELETSNGRISFSGELTAGGDNRMTTSNGAIDVELSGTPGVSIDAGTSTGDIVTELIMTSTLIEKDHIIGTIGDGEADLYIRTSNGNVTIR